MKLKQRIINALQLTSIVNGTGTLNLESQNQGKNLKEIADFGNRLDLLSNDIQSQQNRHTEYRNEMVSQPTTKTSNTTPAGDPRHPYYGHRPTKPPHYRNNFKQRQNEHKEIKGLIEEKKENFYHLKEQIVMKHSMGIDETQMFLQNTQNLYEEFRTLKDRLLNNRLFMEEQREAIHAFLKEETVPNGNKALREYLEMYNFEIKGAEMDQLMINSLITDCERMINELQEVTKSKDPHLENSSTTKTPTISSQEEGLLTRNKELSTNFNSLTQEINDLRGQANELQSQLFWNKQFPGETLPYNRHDLEADLDHIKNDQLPKLEEKRTAIQSEIIKEKKYIESLVKDEKINASKATAYINEYNEIINNFEESMNHLDNKRNKREKVVNPSPSENTFTTATTPASPTPAINATTPEQPTPAIKTATTEKSTSVMNVATTTESPTPAINVATPEKTTLAINAATPEKTTLAINATTPEQPTLAKTTTTESPTLSIPETYIQRRNKMLELKFDMVMQETKALNEQFLEIDNFFLSKKKAHDFTFSKTNEVLSLRKDYIKDKLLPKLKNETILVQDQIMNEKNYINSLVKTGEMSSLKAEEYMNAYDKLTNQFEKWIDVNKVDIKREDT